MVGVPAEELLGQHAGRGVVHGREHPEETEVGVRLLAGDAGDGHVQPAADGLGDGTEGDGLVPGAVQDRPGGRRFQGQPVQPRRVIFVDGGPVGRSVANIAGDAFVAGDGDQPRDEAVRVGGAVYGRGEPDDRRPDPAAGQGDGRLVGGDPRPPGRRP